MRVNLFSFLILSLFYIIPFQDLIASLLYYYGAPHLLIKVLLISKELIVVFLGFIIFLESRKLSALSILFFCLILYAALLAIVFSPLGLYSSLLGFRTYLLLFFGILIGEHLINVRRFEEAFYKHLSIVFYLVVAFSFLEYFFLPMTIWKEPFPIMEMKREVANLVTHNEYYDFGYPVNAFGELTRRLLGPFNEPLYMAYFSAIVTNFFLIQWICGSKNFKAKSLLGLLLILLTQTRAIILGLLLSISSFLVKEMKIKIRAIQFLLIFLTASVPLIAIYYDWVFAMITSIFSKGGRNIGHLDAYVTGLKLLIANPFGLGVGSATTIVGFTEQNNATENAFINIGIELGWLGISTLFLFFVFIIFRFHTFLVRNSSQHTIQKYHIVAAVYLLSIQFAFAGLVAPHILTARILIPFAILVGWSYGIAKRSLL